MCDVGWGDVFTGTYDLLDGLQTTQKGGGGAHTSLVDLRVTRVVNSVLQSVICSENFSNRAAISRAPVFMSGAGMSSLGPMISLMAWATGTCRSGGGGGVKAGNQKFDKAFCTNWHRPQALFVG